MDPEQIPLRDLHLPEAIGWWPLAPGWWLVIAIALVGIGYFIRANLVRLAPGGTINEHRDGNFSLTHSHRVHVPIITNDRVLFNVGRETLSIP